MSKDDSVSRFCSMPAQFRERGDVSIIDLFAESGGTDLLNQLDETDVVKMFSRNPDWVDSWCRWSEDQRSSPAWFIREIPDKSSWEVGFYPEGDSIYFDSRVAACARFALNYLKGLDD